MGQERGAERRTQTNTHTNTFACCKSAHTEAGGSVTSHRPAAARGEGGRRREGNKEARSPTAAVQTFFKIAHMENITKHTMDY